MVVGYRPPKKKEESGERSLLARGRRRTRAGPTTAVGRPPPQSAGLTPPTRPGGGDGWGGSGHAETCTHVGRLVAVLVPRGDLGPRAGTTTYPARMTPRPAGGSCQNEGCKRACSGACLAWGRLISCPCNRLGH